MKDESGVLELWMTQESKQFHQENLQVCMKDERGVLELGMPQDSKKFHQEDLQI